MMLGNRTFQGGTQLASDTKRRLDDLADAVESKQKVAVPRAKRTPVSLVTKPHPAAVGGGLRKT